MDWKTTDFHSGFTGVHIPDEGPLEIWDVPASQYGVHRYPADAVSLVPWTLEDASALEAAAEAMLARGCTANGRALSPVNVEKLARACRAAAGALVDFEADICPLLDNELAMETWLDIRWP